MSTANDGAIGAQGNRPILTSCAGAVVQEQQYREMSSISAVKSGNRNENDIALHTVKEEATDLQAAPSRVARTHDLLNSRTFDNNWISEVGCLTQECAKQWQEMGYNISCPACPLILAFLLMTEI